LRSLVIIPTYNERANLTPLARAILAVDPALDILVVDDNSPDGTGAAAEALAAETARVHLLRRPAKAGLGTAYLAGFQHTRERWKGRESIGIACAALSGAGPGRSYLSLYHETR